MDLRAFAFLRDLARNGVPLRVRGGCMEPLIRSGDEVLVRRRRVYLPGDVIVFRTRAGDLAAHRILGYRWAGLVTQGDHCAEHDAPVGREAVVGAVAGFPVSLTSRVAALARLARIIRRRVLR